MQQEADDAEDAEALRRRLYRPDASAADLATYLHAAAADERGAEPAAAPQPERGRRWPFVVGAAAVLSAALLGGTLLTASLAPRATPSPTVSAGAEVGARDRFTEGVQAVAVSDRGPRDGASGHAQAALRGRYLYTIARGDQVTAVASRFGLCTADVLTALPYGADQAKLPRGQVLLLEHVSDTAREYDSTGAC